MSQSLWQIGKTMQHAFFPLPNFFFLFNHQPKCQVWVTTFVHYEIWNLIVGWTRYKTKINQSREFKKFYIMSNVLLLCLSYLLMYILEKKIEMKKKIESLNFAESNAHRKTNGHGSFETLIFLFSLILCLLKQGKNTIQLVLWSVIIYARKMFYIFRRDWQKRCKIISNSKFAKTSNYIIFSYNKYKMG